MVQHNQHVGVVVQHGEQFGKVLLGGIGGEGDALSHNRFSASAGQVMDAQVEDGIAERDAPLQGNGNPASLGNDPQEQRCLNAVVVRKRDDAGEVEYLLDLFPF